MNINRYALCKERSLQKIISKQPKYCITDEDGNVVDSCSGFIGDDLEKNGMLNYICDYIEK